MTQAAEVDAHDARPRPTYLAKREPLHFCAEYAPAHDGVDVLGVLLAGGRR